MLIGQAWYANQRLTVFVTCKAGKLRTAHNNIVSGGSQTRGSDSME